ncbi:two-component system activity regulator YycH [Bacillus sp. 165]|uniref:YycH family regulatory protein n=1 Tax=Bacillus sp. 165 TaxID=1529117 RepID=UPI001ADAFE69|nr:two-component system activity regulator YycH [Bacillus sp. 165]MBO9131343.1 hypothetical protein [Bacillus sp. 165]
MNIETFKVILLTNLVLVSLVLTYTLWTYQPHNEDAQNTKYIQDVAITNKKEVNDLLLPSQAIFHQNGTHLVNEQFSSMNSMYKLIEKGEFHEFRDLSYDNAPKHQFLSFVHGKGSFEIIFPDEIPLETVKRALTIKEKHLESYNFDRIILDIEKSQDDNINTYFVSYEDRKVYEMTLQGVTLKEVQTAINQFKKSDSSYACFMYEIDKNRAVFLPKEKKVLQRMLYVTSELQAEVFKNALFTNPKYVKKNITDMGEEYTDGTRLLSVEKHTQMLEYINSSITKQDYLEGDTLFQRSMDFVNSHGGWTDSYHFYKMDSDKGGVLYRLFVDDLPVFNNSGMATLRQVWGADEIISYRRPLFKLLLKKEGDQVELPSGTELIQVLKKDPQKQAIQNIQLGYELQREPTLSGDRLIAVKLEPIWVISYKNGYKKIQFDEIKKTGGDIIGLE